MAEATPLEGELHLRPAAASDSPSIIALVDAVYREYGDTVCLDNADRDLLSPGEHYAQLGGEFVVLARGDDVVGIHAVVPITEQPGVCTFRRLYLDKSLRGSGAGEMLMRWAIEKAKELGFRRVEFWSDTRFARAHRFFERLGFIRDGRVRQMNDAWDPYEEYFFSRDL